MLQPISVVGAVPRRNTIVFKHPDEEIVVSSHLDIIWEVLYHSDGLTSTEQIARKVAKAKAIGIPEAHQVIDDLIELGVIVDSRQAFTYTHRLGNNLSPFVVDLSIQEIVKLQESTSKPIVNGKIYDLANSEPISTIQELSASRKSCRSYSQESLSINDFSEILKVAYSTSVSPVPSAGGLNPLRLYAVVIRKIGNLPTGLYEYDRNKSVVCMQEGIDIQAAEFAFNSDSLLHNSPVIFVIAGDLYRQPAKYANRGYRYLLLEAGHIAQNMHLSCVELGLGSLEYGGFLDEKLRDLFKMDNGIVPLIAVAVGKIKNSSTISTDDFATQVEYDLVGRNKPVNWVRIANSPSGEEGYSFFHAVSHFRSGSHDNAKASHALRHCGGTGSSSSVAKLKAIAEGFERYSSGQVRFDRLTKAADFDETVWLDPRVYAPYALEQLTADVQEQFSESNTYEWIQGELYSDKRTIFVPIDLVFYPLSAKRLGRKLCHFANSSGAARVTK